ncbi:MAG: LCP family protein [Lacisediminihabitans sp.]
MTRRSWWLVALNLLIPGSAQLLAGNRRLGRFGVATTFVLWSLAIVTLLTFWFAPSIVYSIATNAVGLTVVQVLLAGYALLWVVLTLDTLRLVRLVRTFPGARAFVAGLAVVALVTTAGTASYGAFVAGVARSAIASVFSDGAAAPPINGRYNILLLGGDAGPDRTGLRPDSISVASVDAATGATTMIGVPRNMEQIRFSAGSPLYGPFPKGYNCGDNCLIGFLYTYGQEHQSLYPRAVVQGSQPGIEAMRDAVAGVLGIKLQYYVLIDMQGFSDLIDALGGITIDVKQRQPIGGGEDANGQPINVVGWVEPGVQKMSGFTALWYSRARHGTNDYDRMARQREVQQAVLTQFQPANVLTKFEAIAKAGTQVVKTDIPAGMLGRFVELADKSRKLPVKRLELVPPTYNPAYPDYAKLHQAVADAIVLSAPTPAP